MIFRFSQAIRRSSLRRGKPIKSGTKRNEWKAYRDQLAASERDEDGILYCQCHTIGQRRCGIGLPELDLHHIKGREVAPKLYYERSNLVWLTREHHEKAHGR